jgi:hypothetical protein
MSAKRPMTAAELSANLRANPEFLAKQKERDSERAERSARLRAEEEPVLADLRELGYEVKSVWDLVNSSSPYAAAIPVLVKHLQRPYPDPIRGGIARALAVPDARHLWPTLVEEYRAEPAAGPAHGLGAKDGLAAALAAVSSDDVIDELIALAKDKVHGSSRLLLLRGLKKSKSVKAKEAIEELKTDPVLAKEIASWRRKK